MKEEGHMSAHGGLARSSEEGQQTVETWHNQSCDPPFKILFHHFSLRNEVFVEVVFFFNWNSLYPRVFLSPGGVLCPSPHAVIQKACFLSAKWHANGPLLPLLQSSSTAVWWKHLRLSGCCWWTFISCAEQARKKTMPLGSVQILFV